MPRMHCGSSYDSKKEEGEKSRFCQKSKLWMNTDIMQLQMTKYIMAKSYCFFTAAALSMVAAVGIYFCLWMIADKVCSKSC